MSLYIRQLIEQGENQHLDFKFEISDSKKIARTLVAFANTEGGKLLIGVKDNGRIAGIRSEEEYYMLEAAAQMYCKPEISFTSQRWDIEGKSILEVTVPKSDKMPHSAPDPHNKWMIYVRVADQNLLANTTLIKYWKRRRNKKGTFITYTESEKILLRYLLQKEYITMSKFQKISGLSRWKAENIIVNLMSIDIIALTLTEKNALYSLKNKEKQLLIDDFRLSS